MDVGDILILKSDQISRSFWNVAKVEELIPGKDDVVRSARVCIINDGGKRTILRRPVQHLIPLEARSQSSTTEEDVQPSAVTNERPRRKAAEMCEAARKDFLKHC